MENKDDIQSLTSLLVMVALIGLVDNKIGKITEGEVPSITAQVKKLTSQTINPWSLLNNFKTAKSEDWTSIKNPSIYISDILVKYCLNGNSSLINQELPSNTGLHWLKFKHYVTVRAISLRSGQVV